MPEEDSLLCVHDWKDMYGGDGSDQKDPYKAYQAFYCTKCIEIRVKSWSRLRYRLNREYLEEIAEENDDLTASAL